MRTLVGGLLLVAALFFLGLGAWMLWHGRADAGLTRWGILILGLWYIGSRKD